MMFGMNLARCPTRRDSYRNHAEAGPADKIFAGCFFFIESRSTWRADRLSFPNESHVSTNTQQRELPGSERRTIPHASHKSCFAASRQSAANLAPRFQRALKLALLIETSYLRRVDRRRGSARAGHSRTNGAAALELCAGVVVSRAAEADRGVKARGSWRRLLDTDLDRRLVNRASVLDCGSPLPLFTRSVTRPAAEFRPLAIPCRAAKAPEDWRSPRRCREFPGPTASSTPAPNFFGHLSFWFTHE